MPQKQLEMTLLTPKDQVEREILETQREVDYDTKEYTVELLVDKLIAEEIYVPEYQRKFIWSHDRRSKFIESVIIGLPIPYMFCSDMPDGRLEVIDGVQRLNTLREFLASRLMLTDLEKLTSLNGYNYEAFPTSQQRKFKNRTLRMIVLKDRGDAGVRFDLFERINSTSTTLSPAEFRKGAFRGSFYSLVLELAEDAVFRKLCPVSDKVARRGEREELILRFFAYADRYQEFTHDVTKFLNKYIRDMNRDADIDTKKEQFNHVMLFVEKHFPYGFAKSVGARTTPRVRFEAISVGVHLALLARPNLVPASMGWLESKDFNSHTTTHASNSAPRLKGRIEFVKNALLGA